ncbi:MAG: hypothetical protein J0H37_00305 [Hyphomicrobium denitrificans]|nr:hypothetical protein [Hyphomicrobium denitrificans]
MFDNDNEGKILAFKNKAPEGRNGNHNPHRVLFSAASSRREVESDSRRRAIPSAPVRVLDAPQIADDYYLNVLDWGANNSLAVALAQSVYLWNADTGATASPRTAPPANTPRTNLINGLSDARASLRQDAINLSRIWRRGKPR